MENDEITHEPEVEQEEGTEVVEETTAEETTEVVETPEERLAKAEAEANKYRRLFEKATKPKPKVEAPQTSSSNVEETVLLANGMPDDLLSELKVIASVRKTSLIKAQNDPIFVAIKDRFEKDQKQKAASLPASRGSGNTKVKKDFSTPGLSREEHKALALGK